MAVSPLMSLAVRTMSAHQAALQATGHNIANAHVAGYSRQQAEFATAGGQFSGNGFFGRGVDVQTISRLHSTFLTREAVATRASASMDEARLQQLLRLEQVFPLGEQGLGNATTRFMDALSDLSSRPEDPATRQVVLARAEDMANRFRAAHNQLSALQGGVTEELKVTVERVNTLTSGIAVLNEKISSIHGLGQEPNDLLDQRDRLVAELSGLVSVTTIAGPYGTLGVFGASGQQLVLGSSAQTLAVVADDRDPSRSAIAAVENGQSRLLDSASVGSGRIGGLLAFQNQDLVAARNGLGQLARTIAEAVNTQHKLGVNLYPPAGSVPAADVFGFGAERVLAATGNATGTGGVQIAVVGASELHASDYDLRLEGGVWQLTRLSDGQRSTVVDGDTVDGFTITIGAPAPQDGDRFLLQPVGQAGLMNSLLRDPRDLAAASPAAGATPFSNNGNALALAALRDAKIVGQIRDSGSGLLVGGSTSTDGYASLLADVGVRVQGAGTLAEVSTEFARQAEEARASASGVNLDEEAARLIEFQQSYQAAAKVLQVAQTLMDTLLQAAGR